MKQGYASKYFSVLGDSISTLEGWSRPEYAAFYDVGHKLEARIYSPSDTWWGELISSLGGKLLQNNSISGSTASFRPGYETESYGCSRERTSSLGDGDVYPDVIMILIGTNDWGMGVDVYPTDGDMSDISVFSCAYNTMLKRLKDNYPKAELWCFTLPVSCFLRSDEVVFPYLYGGIHISEYCEAIRKIAKENGARVIDLYNPSEPYDTIDGFHPTREGMHTLFLHAENSLAEEGII